MWDGLVDGVLSVGCASAANLRSRSVSGRLLLRFVADVVAFGCADSSFELDESVWIAMMASLRHRVRRDCVVERLHQLLALRRRLHQRVDALLKLDPLAHLLRLARRPSGHLGRFGRDALGACRWVSGARADVDNGEPRGLVADPAPLSLGLAHLGAAGRPRRARSHSRRQNAHSLDRFALAAPPAGDLRASH